MTIEQETRKWEVLKEKLKTQLGLTDDELNKKYESLKAEAKAKHPSASEEDVMKRARISLRGEYKRQRMSPAVYFEGMIIRDMGCIDVERGRREAAIAAFQADAEKAIADGITDANGTPLETRATWPDGSPNPMYGKPLPEHRWLRNIEGVARTMKSELKPFTLTLRDKKALEFKFPTFTPVSFRANIKQETPAGFVLNQSVLTDFTRTNISIDVYKDVLPFYQDKLVDLKDIRQFHDANANDWRRMAIVQGDVLFIGDETRTGNIPMAIDDDSLELDATGVTCWVPGHFNIDFGIGSRVIVVANTSLGKNREGQEEVFLNVQGLYAIPEWKVESSESTAITKIVDAE